MALIVLIVMFLALLSARGGFENATPPQTTEDESVLEDEDLSGVPHIQNLFKMHFQRKMVFFFNTAMPDKSRRTRSRRFAVLFPSG